MTLAHPLTDGTSGLALPPLAIAVLAAVLIAATLTLVPLRPAARRDVATADVLVAPDAAAPLGRFRAVTRALVVAVVVLGIYAARRGSPDGLSNITPALLVGVAWPALVVGAVCVRRLWTWLDPWDAMARVIEPLAGGAVVAAEPPEERIEATESTDPAEVTVAPAAPSVWPGVVTAAAVIYFLVAQPGSTQPRTIGAALAGYTIAMVVVGVALGRQVLARTEVFGLTARWAGRLRERLGADWAVPRGAEAVLGVLAGGLLFDVARRVPGYDPALRTGWLSWASTGDIDRDVRMLLGLSCVVGVAVMVGAERWAARRGAQGTVALTVLPVVLALLVVVKVRRLLVSLQLVPILASDPLGRGWDVFGTAGDSLDANPFGTTAQRWASIALVTLGGLVGAAALRRRTRTARERDPAAVVVSLVVALAALVLPLAL